MFKSGFLQIAEWNGRPIRVHWSALLGAFVFTRFRFVPGAWLGYFLLILVHELGHATVVRQVKAKVLRVDITGFGGECWWQGNVTPIQRACIAWGGVWAQLLFFVPAFLLMTFRPPLDNDVLMDLGSAFVWTNLWIAAVNLMPIPPLDGSQAWALFPLLWRRFRAQRQDVADRDIMRANDLSRVELRYRDALERDVAKPPAEVKALVSGVIEQARREASGK